MPQVYWKTIGDTVDSSLAHTYKWNRALPPPGLSARPDLREPPGRPAAPVPPDVRRLRGRGRELVVVAGDRRPGVERRSAPRSTRRIPTRPRLPAARAGLARRHRRPAPGAASRGRPACRASTACSATARPGRSGGSRPTAGSPESGAADGATWRALRQTSARSASTGARRAIQPTCAPGPRPRLRASAHAGAPLARGCG